MWSRFDLRAAWKVADIVRRGGYRIIHGHTVRTAMIGGIAARLAGVPMVYHAHSPASHDTHAPLAQPLQRHRRAAEPAARRADHRRFAGDGRAHGRSRASIRERITVVHNGVPAPQSLPDRPPPRGHLDAGHGGPVPAAQGIEVLLEAMAMLRRQGVPVHLRAVGAFESPAYAGGNRRAACGGLDCSEHISWTGFPAT